MALHGTFLALALYFGAHHTVTVPEELPLTLSLRDYAPSADTAQNNVPSAPTRSKQVPILPKTAPTPPKPTVQAIPHSTSAVSPEAFTPQPAPVRPGVVPSDTPLQPVDLPHSNHEPLLADSPILATPVVTNELPRTNVSQSDINGATLGRIRALIENSVTYPSIARKLRLEGTVIVSFVLKPDGFIEKAEILASSGSPLLDTKAVQTVLELSGEYPALPKTAYLKIPISFSLTKS